MKTRFLCGLVALTFAPMLAFGASLSTSYFLNVEAITNVTARSAVRGLTGVFTNSVSGGGFATSGTTNATLTGNLLANGAVFTNGLTAGGGTFTGAVGFADGTAAAPSIGWTSDADGTGTGFYRNAANQIGASINGTRVGSFTSVGFELLAGNVLNWNGDAIILRDGAANTLALRNSTSAQTFNIYNTYTDASNYERGSLAWSGNSLYLRSQNAGTGSSRSVVLDGSQVIFQTASNSRWRVDANGHFTAGTDNTYDIGASGATRPRFVFVADSLVAPSTGTFYVQNRLRITSSADGIALLANNATTDFNRLQFGGTTASFPALKRSTTNIVVRLADDSANTGLEANVVISRLNATSAAAPTIASDATIAPTNSIVFISGTTAIDTITSPAPISATGGQITLIPTGIFTTTTAGNIALASTAVVSKALIMTYDSVTTKWYPSY